MIKIYGLSHNKLIFNLKSRFVEIMVKQRSMLKEPF